MSDFSILAVRASDEPVTDYYPLPAATPDTVEPEEEDGGDVSVVMASAFSVKRDIGGLFDEVASINDLCAEVVATSCRVTVACTKYIKGRGGWVGFGIGGVAAAVTMNIAARAQAAHARRGKTLVGHVRYPWVEAVLFQDGSVGVTPTVRLILQDPLDDVRRTLAFDIALHRSESASAFATDLVVLAACHLRDTDLMMPPASADHMDAIIENPSAGLSADGLWAGFALEPGCQWLT